MSKLCCMVRVMGVAPGFAVRRISRLRAALDAADATRAEQSVV